MKSLIKAALNGLAWAISRNREMLKYFFTHSINKELRYYMDYSIVETYPHIIKLIELIKRTKGMDITIVDIGGADGKTAEMFARAMPGNPVLVFEPLSSNQDKLRALQQRYSNIRIIPKALGDRVETMEMYITSRITSSSLLRPLETASIGSDLMKEAASTTTSEKVSVSTLNEELKALQGFAVLKIDVQGFELKVLQGAADVIDRVLLVVVEVSNHDVYENSPAYYDIDAWMRNSGFLLLDMCLSFREKSVLREWDAIYIHKKHLDILN